MLRFVKNPDLNPVAEKAYNRFQRVVKSMARREKSKDKETGSFGG